MCNCYLPLDGGKKMYKHLLKRLIDIVLSFCAIIVLAFPMAIISIIVKIDSKGPALFKQKRVGKDKKLFTILKFRSMPVAAPHDIPTHQLENADDMLSGFQHFIRKTSIDELPQIFNIFVGQMSIIGPRPALWNQYDLIAERDKYGANSVRPGLTGWAQINGRDELEIEEKARLDGEYIAKQSFSFDVKCFMGTVFSVLKSNGVVEGGTGAIHEKENALHEEAETKDSELKTELTETEKAKNENEPEGAAAI